MEMKANVASAIKEMMAQMTSGTNSETSKKEDEHKEEKSISDIKTTNEPANISEPETKKPKEKIEEKRPEPVSSKITPEHETAPVHGLNSENAIPNKSSVQNVKTPPIAENAAPDKITYDRTIIANGTVIHGSVISAGDLELRGEVSGDVKVNGNLCLWGKIEGDVESGNINILGGKIKGNIASTGIVTLDINSIIAGNVTAAALSLDGKLKGDVNIEGTVTIGGTGIQIGKINAKDLSIGKGAKLNSTIEMASKDSNIVTGEKFTGSDTVKS